MKLAGSSLSYILITIVIIIGFLVLCGWFYDISPLRRPLPQLAAMNPATAVGFILLGSSFFLTTSKTSLQLKGLGRSIAIMTQLLGALKFVLIKTSLPIDQILFRKKVLAEIVNGLPTGMALNTAVCFILGGLSVLMLDYESAKKRMPAHYFSLIIFLCSFFSILGYLFNADEFSKVINYLPMAIHTAVGFILFSVSVLCWNPYKGISKEITAELSGAYVSRMMIPVAIIVPILLGYLSLYVYKRQWLSAAFSITLLINLIIVVFCSVIWYSTLLLNKKDVLRKEAEDKLRESEEIFRSLTTSIKDYAIFMLDVNGNVVTWNKGAEFIKGYTEDEIKGKNINVFYRMEDQESGLPSFMLASAQQYGSYETEGYRVRKDGKVFWATIVITALYANQGELRGYVKVTRDSTENKRSKDILANFNRELNRQVVIKTAQLQRTNIQLRQLAAYLQTVREEEREKMGREVHDQLGQLMVGLKMDIKWLQKNNFDTKNEDVHARFERALDLLTETHETVRNVAKELHPSNLRTLGLVAALDSYFKQFMQRSEIIVSFEHDLCHIDDRRFSPDIAIGLYRVVQESLTNTLKHAAAKTVSIWLQVKKNRLILSIHDDGNGFDPIKIKRKKTLGLISIRERVMMLNGTHRIESFPGEGTYIEIDIPLKVK